MKRRVIGFYYGGGNRYLADLVVCERLCNAHCLHGVPITHEQHQEMKELIADGETPYMDDGGRGEVIEKRIADHLERLERGGA